MEFSVEESKVLKPTSVREVVYDYLRDHPDANIHQIYWMLGQQGIKYEINTVKVYKAQFRKGYKARAYERYIERVIKSGVLQVLNIFSTKIQLTGKLKTIEQESLTLLEEWSGFKEWKMEQIVKSVELKGRG